MRAGALVGAAQVALVLAWAVGAEAQVGVDTTTTVFRESGGGGELEMLVITPSLDVHGTIRDRVTLRAGWEADIVSGASVAVVDAPSGEVDAITSATRLDDFRNTASAGATVRGDTTELTVGYSYGTESDYRSHGFQLSGRAEMFERNTAVEVSYARGWDQVCNLRQPRAQEAVDRARLPSSDGCFEADDRESLDLDLQSFQGAWTQAWAPILATQLTLTLQLLDGYQANPYRAVWLGRSAAQENHPTTRARYAAGLGVRLWLAPLHGALQLYGRLYRDDWDIASVTAELAYEQSIGGSFRIRARGRYYNQTGAAFFSDDYVRFPRGQYFTGDRELSPMSSWVVGAQLHWTAPPGDDGRVGFLGALDLIAKVDLVKYDFRAFRYGSAAVPNDSALVATLGIQTLF